MKTDFAGGVRGLTNPFSAAARPATGPDVKSAWGAALKRASEELAVGKENAAPGRAHAGALEKLSELLLGYALRQMTPAQSTSENGLAFDTWRGMFADAVAHNVAPRVVVLPQVKLDGAAGK